MQNWKDVAKNMERKNVYMSQCLPAQPGQSLTPVYPVFSRVGRLKTKIKKRRWKREIGKKIQRSKTQSPVTERNKARKEQRRKKVQRKKSTVVCKINFEQLFLYFTRSALFLFVQ